MSDLARAALALNRRHAMILAEKVGGDRIQRQLLEAAKELEERLRFLSPSMAGTFTEVRMNATLAQIRHVLYNLRPGMSRAIVQTALDAADVAGAGVVDYLTDVEAGFRGIGVQPLALDESSMLDSAREGAKSSVLRRLMSSGENVPGAEAVPHQAKMGILDRYGVNVVGHFEDQLRIGMLTRKPWADIRESLVAKSPFLQGAPAHWAERIVRTETMGAYNRAGLESIHDADEQLGDMVKILSATFDDRTAADSYAVHGQIRRTTEPFDTWAGPVMNPPARPNDREIVVPHRVSWPIPAYLVPKKRGAVVARWAYEGRKGSPPPTPLDSTIPRGQFGRTPPPQVEENARA